MLEEKKNKKRREKEQSKKDQAFQTFLKTVGKNIRRERKEIKHIKQKDLAFETRINTNTISNIERGETPARLDTIYKIAKVLKVEPDTLLKTSAVDIKTVNTITNLLTEISIMNDNDVRKFLGNIDEMVKIFDQIVLANKHDKKLLNDIIFKK